MNEHKTSNNVEGLSKSKLTSNAHMIAYEKNYQFVLNNVIYIIKTPERETDTPMFKIRYYPNK